MKSLVLIAIISNITFGGLVASGNVRMPDNTALPPEIQQGIAKAKSSFGVLESFYASSTLENDLIASLPINEIKRFQSYEEADINLEQAATYLRDNNVTHTVKASFTGLLKSLSSKYVISLALPKRS